MEMFKIHFSYTFPDIIVFGGVLALQTIAAALAMKR